MIVKEISKPLVRIFNLPNIPDSLKIAIVTPTFKGNDEKQIWKVSANICTELLFKFIGKTLTKSVSKLIDRNNILSKCQYGFRKNRWTELAIYDFADKITKAIDHGKFTVGIFLDLSKAFNTVNHKILIGKLKHYGIRGAAKKWFENYLYNRVQSEEITGVPQGSVLGPLLFLYT